MDNHEFPAHRSGEPRHGKFRRSAGHGRQRCGQLRRAGGPGNQENTVPSGKHTKNYRQSPFLVGKSTISSYVKLPEGRGAEK